MTRRTIWYATNRRHEGRRWEPSSYGPDFSSDGLENLRFGAVSVSANEAEIKKHFARKTGTDGDGNGTALSDYFSELAGSAKIRAYRESLDPSKPEGAQSEKAYGSRRAFAELQEAMLCGVDTVVFIHGYNVSWNEAVGSALALQELSLIHI